MQGDAFFIIGLLLFIFVAWVATGGPERPISFAGPYLTPVRTYGDRSEAYGTLPELRLGDGTRSGVSGSRDGTSIRDIKESLDDLQQEVLDANLLSNPSPYRGVVSLGGTTSGAKKTLTREEYVSIQVSGRADSAVSITGWRLESSVTGSWGIIPEGAEIPRSGTVNRTTAIRLAPGERAIIVSGRSPIGVSFRENMCMPYFEERQDFSPSLPGSCPALSGDYDRLYVGNPLADDECYEYVREEVERCEVVTRAPGDLSDACESFVETYASYNGCILAHGADENFLGRTWRVYLGARSQLWKDEREIIRLLDTSGKTVDVLTY